MNKDILEGDWNEVKGWVQKRWGKLTNDDLDQIEGDRTKLAGKIQKAYGLQRDEAEKQLKDWEDKSSSVH